MSVSSLDSPRQGHASPVLPLHPPQRMLARTGERFKFSVPLVVDVQSQKKLDVRLVSGRPLPRFIRANADTVDHPVGTVAMGKDGEGALDSHLRVRGTVGLRVVDASAFVSPLCW